MTGGVQEKACYIPGMLGMRNGTSQPDPGRLHTARLHMCSLRFVTRHWSVGVSSIYIYIIDTVSTAWQHEYAVESMHNITIQ